MWSCRPIVICSQYVMAGPSAVITWAYALGYQLFYHILPELWGGGHRSNIKRFLDFLYGPLSEVIFRIIGVILGITINISTIRLSVQ